MSPIDAIADSIQGSVNLIEMHLGDFSDADMMKRPTPGANHTAWQLGHMIVADSNMIAAFGGSFELPPDYKAQFNKETAKSDDPAKFPKKAELLANLKKTRQAAAAVFRKLTNDDLDRPSSEGIRAIAPKLGHLGVLMVSHATMHVGQIQVIRRALGKPVLF